jgi:hypothetical protein
LVRAEESELFREPGQQFSSFSSHRQKLKIKPEKRPVKKRLKILSGKFWFLLAFALKMMKTGPARGTAHFLPRKQKNSIPSTCRSLPPTRKHTGEYTAPAHTVIPRHAGVRPPRPRAPRAARATRRSLRFGSADVSQKCMKFGD